MSDHAEIQARLREHRDVLERRMGRIRDDRRGVSAPIERDSQERAVQRENDDVLDALDAVGIAELEETRAALDRIDAGTFGVCEECKGPVGEGRLDAVPTARRCIDCEA